RVPGEGLPPASLTADEPVALVDPARELLRRIVRREDDERPAARADGVAELRGGGLRVAELQPHVERAILVADEEERLLLRAVRARLESGALARDALVGVGMAERDLLQLLRVHRRGVPRGKHPTRARVARTGAHLPHPSPHDGCGSSPLARPAG